MDLPTAPHGNPAADARAASEDAAAEAAPDPRARARDRMRATGQWSPAQAMGRRWSIGCVAVEVTQRCNLDCTLCYLSESAEAVRDVPLDAIFRRLDRVRATFGAGTNVQITGGDPTLRDRGELVAVVRRAAALGLRPALFTNGIRATRSLLSELAEAGLVDVAFHVDLTQERKGYATESDLNAVRQAYIGRAAGLGLAIHFNTTVFAGNVGEIPTLVGFFVDNADRVTLASFQLQADTGRGVTRGRPAAVAPDGVAEAIARGAGGGVRFGQIRPGHAACNRYAVSLVSGRRVVPIADDDAYVAHMLAATESLELDRARPGRSAILAAGWLLRRPAELPRALGWGLGRLRALGWRGRPVHKLSFFIHDFMHADCLDPERIEACIFHCATAEGTRSMCAFNAEREARILEPLAVEGGYWDPLTGGLDDRPPPVAAAPALTRKTAKGHHRRYGEWDPAAGRIVIRSARTGAGDAA